MPKQERLLDQIIDDLYEGIVDSEAWTSAVRRMTALLGARGQLCISLDPSTGRAYREQSYGYEAKDVTEYHEHWATRDPRFAPGLELPLGVPVTEHDLLPMRHFRRSEFFNEFLLECDAPWLLGTSLHSSPTKWTYFSVYGSLDRQPFGETARANMRRLVPHIRRSLEIQDRLDSANMRAAAFSGALEHASFGTLILDATGFILDAAESALAALKEAGALSRESGGLFTLRDPAGGLLRKLLGSSMHAGALEDGSIQLSRGPGRLPLSLVIVPAPQALASWFLHDACWLGLLFDPEARVEVSEEMLRDSLGLTAREAQVVALLVGGLSPKDIATRLGVSFHTVRTQLKSVFLKTGVTSQSELVRKVMAGPAVQPGTGR